MKLSYWEYKTWLSNVDYTIVGSGIVGLNCALFLKEKYPKAKVVVLEKGVLPQGASTKNAGFACFGSISEILADLEYHSEEETIELVQKRWNGIQLLRQRLGDSSIGFKQYGGHELFLKKHQALYHTCLYKMREVNELLNPVFGATVFETHENSFGFKGIEEKYITHNFEGQIDTGKMMLSLLKRARTSGIEILNAVSVEAFEDEKEGVTIQTQNFEFKTRKLCVATNGFTSQLLKETVKPARAQVLITKPITDLAIKGAFHLEEGYYYFRNIEDRILLGGGRNLDFEGEETTVFAETTLIQEKLETILRENILPDTPFVIDRRWSGIMGMGSHKSPIVKQISNNVYCGVRLGGMGIAIGALVGKELADLV